MLELAALASLGYAGAQVSVVLAVAAPLAFAAVWGVVASPRAPVKLAPRPKTAVRLALLLGAAAALAAAGQGLLALVFALVTVADVVVLAALGRPVAGG